MGLRPPEGQKTPTPLQGVRAQCSGLGASYSLQVFLMVVPTRPGEAGPALVWGLCSISFKSSPACSLKGSELPAKLGKLLGAPGHLQVQHGVQHPQVENISWIILQEVVSQESPLGF